MIKDIRTGIGFDVHAFTDNRKLIIGGVEIPFDKGLLGHSDADVLIHAVCDAMLGALALGDIGKHFPDTDQSFKDADSRVLLGKVNELIVEKGFAVNNVDVMLMMQKPKIAPYIENMIDNISGILGLEKDRISIKATTTEKLGFVGRGEGVSSLATVLLIKS